MLRSIFFIYILYTEKYFVAFWWSQIITEWKHSGSDMEPLMGFFRNTCLLLAELTYVH